MRPFLFFIAALSAVSAVAQVQVDSKNRLVLGSTLPGISQLDKCEDEVFLNGGEILKGGTLDIRAKNVRMGKGFKVHPGGILKIQNR